MRNIWQNQPQPKPLTPVLDGLIADTQAQHAKLVRTVFWRDVREIGVALLLIPITIGLGLYRREDWAWYLVIAPLLFIAAFMMAHRRRRQRDQPRPEDSLTESLSKAVREVEHQIWLLRNVHWWYIGPLLLALYADDVVGFLQGQRKVSELITSFVFLGAIGGFIYWLNLHAIRKELEPRRTELRGVLEQLAMNAPA